MTGPVMFDSVLVANRGEIAVRIMRTLADFGIRSIAVYSDADAGARHVAEADVAVRLGPAPAAESYLDADAVVAAAVGAGAEAVHPGYGFLSENAPFARAVVAAGVVWLGPPPEAIEAMGDKIAAKRTVAAAGVPVVPGRGEAGLDDEALAVAALEVGLPVLLKPSAGGGGKGMRLVTEDGDLRREIAAARREARHAFGDDTILVERWVESPRHIEVQILADTHGRVIGLGERECSLQRRHQKIIEEAPSPLLDDATRARLSASAVDAARACGYVGVGTVEFIVSATRPDEYFFMEMNTRLQVEHPVTEATWGLDLVAWQLRVAAGEHLPWADGELGPQGHAIEARVYAEDPNRGFLPATGTVLAQHDPAGAGVRVDSSLAPGTVVGPDYDPMLSKVVAWGTDREQARRRLRRALQQTVVLGVTTNIGFLARLLDQPDVVAARLDTGLVERALPELTGDEDTQADAARRAAVTAAMTWALRVGPEVLTGGGSATVVDPWELGDGWRLGAPAATPVDLDIGGRELHLTVTGRPAAAEVRIGGGDPSLVEAEWVGPGRVRVTAGDRSATWDVAGGGTELWVGLDGSSWRARRHLVDAAVAVVAGDGGPVTSPMPGTVLTVLVSEGDEVTAGSALVVVEAMKMEHTVVAPVDGTVDEVRVRTGQSVALDEVLAVVTAGEAP